MMRLREIEAQGGQILDMLRGDSYRSRQSLPQDLMYSPLTVRAGGWQQPL